MIICILGLTVSHPGLSPNQLCSDSNPYRPTVPLTFIRYRINIMYKLVATSAELCCLLVLVELDLFPA